MEVTGVGRDGGDGGEWRTPEVDGGWERTNGSGKGNGEEKAEGRRGAVEERRGEERRGEEERVGG